MSLTAVAAAKSLRTRLKSAFPGVTFSVRCGWGDIEIKWTDGPDADSVRVIGVLPEGFYGRVNLTRSFSPEVMSRAVAAWEQAAGRPRPALYDNVRAVEVGGYRVPAGTLHFQLNTIAARIVVALASKET